MDRHYTPRELADSLLTNSDQFDPETVVDVTVGRGELLSAAERKWPQAALIGTDIDRTAVDWLRTNRPSWDVGRCNILSTRSRSRSGPLRRARESDRTLLLINPPFSVRGGTKTTVQFNGSQVSCSPAIAFLLIGLDLVGESGEARAILPEGSLFSERDSAAWQVIDGSWKRSTVAVNAPAAFPGCVAKTVLLRLTRADRTRRTRSSACRRLDSANAGVGVRVVRGTFQMHQLDRTADGPVLVHSTDLAHHLVVLNGRRGHGQARTATGPALLLPRVGAITKSKLALLPAGTNVMLSDCVMALETHSAADAEALLKLFKRRFAFLQRHYRGTGAPFITLGRIRDFLKAIGAVEYG